MLKIKYWHRGIQYLFSAGLQLSPLYGWLRRGTTHFHFYVISESIFLGGVAAASMIFGFGTAVSSAKKSDPLYFDKGMDPHLTRETGGSLALRALKWGTIYSITGCSLLFFCIWKIIGANDVNIFRSSLI